MFLVLAFCFCCEHLNVVECNQRLLLLCSISFSRYYQITLVYRVFYLYLFVFVLFCFVYISTYGVLQLLFAFKCCFQSMDEGNDRIISMKKHVDSIFLILTGFTQFVVSFIMRFIVFVTTAGASLPY